jgi:hypothetical protein
MSISPRNLWPEDIAVTDVVAPVTILKEQASLLGERTKNLVEGSVVTPGTVRGVDFMLKNRFSYGFDLVAPALNNYRYRLFSISHGVEFYPLTINGSEALTSDEFHVNNEEEFLKALEAIFSSDKTKGIISSLIAQSRA